MAGHSHWAQIKRKKMAQDQKRGKLFSKLMREIMVAARLGGGNPDTNPRLRRAIDAAKDAGMPKDNIERAIKKGTGELPGEALEEVSYEGYGPAGVAFMLEAITDNKNRTTNEIRRIFSNYGGNLGQHGCVSWMFESKGIIYVDENAVSEEELYDIVIDAGAEDIEKEGGMYKITTSPDAFEQVKEALRAHNIEFKAEFTKIPKNIIKITNKSDAEKILKMMEAFDEHDDIRHVYANFDIPVEIMEEIASKG